jgi:nicotinate phosphoribosyltransferase
MRKRSEEKSRRIANSGHWVNDDNAGTLTDLYQLTMLQSYLEHRMNDTAVFDLFVRRLHPNRNYLVASGLEDVLHYLETLTFSNEHLAYLRSLNRFSSDFLDYLGSLRFTGDVYAVREGTVVFANEPLLEIVAPLPQAQIIETFVINQVHLQTLAASKAARVVVTAQGRSIVDYGLRRIHGTDAGLKAARAFYIAGVDATSNVLAGEVYGIPVSGTMAHSFIQAHDSEYEAFRHFAETFPDGTMLVDTYNTLDGVRHVIQLARELGPAFRVIGIRLDSGDLVALSKQSRRLLDEAGLSNLKIFASGNIDEYAISSLIQSEAPIDGFGVGTHMGTSSDAPYLDMAYKLVEYAGVPRMKFSHSKTTLPGRKQVFRAIVNGTATGDVIASFEEQLPGRSLLEPVMLGGRRTQTTATLADLRSNCRDGIDQLPRQLLTSTPVEQPYMVTVSPRLLDLQQTMQRRQAQQES